MAPVKTEDRNDLLYSPERNTQFLSLFGSRSMCSGGYEMLKRYVLRCERNWVLESESGKEWL